MECLQNQSCKKCVESPSCGWNIDDENCIGKAFQKWSDSPYIIVMQQNCPRVCDLFDNYVSKCMHSPFWSDGMQSTLIYFRHSIVYYFCHWGNSSINRKDLLSFTPEMEKEKEKERQTTRVNQKGNCRAYPNKLMLQFEHWSKNSIAIAPIYWIFF